MEYKDRINVLFSVLLDPEISTPPIFVSIIVRIKENLASDNPTKAEKGIEVVK